jgi:hypothetical protein
MDYDKMKALMEANHQELTVQRDPVVRRFPGPDSKPDQVSKERMAA